jgi:hypothetical protein
MHVSSWSANYRKILAMGARRGNEFFSLLTVLG